ncbi:MAG: ATP-binding response regulator [Steroidobacteraceae bacterium]
MRSIHDGGGGSRREDRARRKAAARGASKARARARRAASAWCARALDGAGLGAFEWDARTDELQGSSKVAALAGFDAGAPPRTLAALLSRVHEADRESLGRTLRAAVAARRSARVDFRIAARGPGVRWLRVRASVFCDARDRPAGLTGVIEDVTPQWHAEAERAALAEREMALRAAAERESRSKSELLSKFSHELRSPLNAILGWNRILAVKRAEDTDVAALAARIERSARSQLKMINDLLELERARRGAQGTLGELAAGRPQRPPVSGRTLDGVAILVVDDEPDAREAVAETLRLEGARVTESDSAARALSVLEDARFDVLITDIGMPVEDGYSLVRKVRRSALGEQMIAVALTGYSTPADREAALRAGFDAHVSKPVDFGDFVPLIARMTHAVREAR